MTHDQITVISARERDPLLQALRAGVVPGRGQHLVQVGRRRELEALIDDVDRIADRGSGFRFVSGPFGSGKTFLLGLVRAVAQQRRLVTVHADLGPGHRLHGSGGEAQALYRALVATMATRAKPDGNALESVVQRFVGAAGDEASIGERLRSLHELPGGYDFAKVVDAYRRGHESCDDDLCANAIRWLRGEFSTKTDAKNALGVRTYVDDRALFPQLHLLARFVRLAGYGGLLVVIDEVANLLKVANSASRKANFERILELLNGTLQGGLESIGYVLGATPEFLMDPRKGLYSYGALATRLAESPYARGAVFAGPVIRLAPLTPEDVLVLLGRLRLVHASGDPGRFRIPDEGLRAFLRQREERLGSSEFCTPRDVTRDFVGLLDALEAEPDATWRDVLGTTPAAGSTPPTGPTTAGEGEGDDNLAAFRL